MLSVKVVFVVFELVEFMLVVFAVVVALMFLTVVVVTVVVVTVVYVAVVVVVAVFVAVPTVIFKHDYIVLKRVSEKKIKNLVSSIIPKLKLCCFLNLENCYLRVKSCHKNHCSGIYYLNGLDA